MSTRTPRPKGQAAAETELLAQLGLPASASPEDVDQLHQAVSDYLSSAPPEIRGWARAQVAAIDAAYIHLTDPAGLEGSALRSPASPPVVVPGGPATPPARRGPDSEATPVASEEAVRADTGADPGATDPQGEPDAEDLAALYAMVTPSAHDDMKPDVKRAKAAPAPPPGLATDAAPSAVTPAQTGPNMWKRIVIGGVGIAAVVAIAFGANAIVNGTPADANPGTEGAAQASPTPPAIDEAKVADLMAKFQADPNDAVTLLALADEFYAGGEYETSGTWLDRLLALKPDDIQGLLARGAVYFNLNDLPNAEATWKKVAVLEPDNVEVHYDLGFLYLNQAEPDWTGVQAEWLQVIELDPGSQLAQTVRSHLDSLAQNSLVPDLPDASGTAPSAAPAASPSASPAANVLNQTALNLAYGTPQLSAPADTPLTIRFDNQDSLPHDIVIKDASGAEVFTGVLITGPKAIDYAVPALKAGAYTFLCSIHPNMTGTLTVGG